jgi:hypothetical protein
MVEDLSVLMNECTTIEEINKRLESDIEEQKKKFQAEMEKKDQIIKEKQGIIDKVLAKLVHDS